MITNPNDYAFVDFSGGLPTGRFCGDIMPLRRAKCLPLAEDVAFLAECVRDKLGAFKGITQNGVRPDPPHEVLADDPGEFKPTWKFQASQMESLRTTLSYALSGANFHRRDPAVASSSFSGYGLLGQQLPRGNTFLDQPERETFDGGLDDFMRDVLYPRYGLNASPSIGRFGRGDVPLESWVLRMYDDAQKLTRPVITIPNYIESIFTVERGSYDSQILPVTRSLGWYMVDNRSSLSPDQSLAYEGHVEWTPDQTIAVIPDAFISGAEAWMVYDAYNRVRLVNDSSISRRTGIIKLADIEDSKLRFGPDGHGAYVLNAVNGPSGGCRALFEKIVGDLGWTLYHFDSDHPPTHDYDVRYQYVDVTYSSRFIIAGTPNGRTQWWD